MKNGLIDYLFCHRLAKKIYFHKLRFRFISISDIIAIQILIGAKINADVDKSVLQIFVRSEDVKAKSFIRTKKIYSFKKIKDYDVCGPNVLINSLKPNKITISNTDVPFTPSKKLSAFQTSFREWNPIVVGPEFSEFLFSAFNVTVEHNNANFTLSTLPAPNLGDRHRTQLKLIVDINHIPSVLTEGILLSRVKNMPKKLKIEKTEKLPIIGFFDNASVICLWNEENNCYKFADYWSGKFGKDLFLDFMFPKPKFVDSSTKVTSLSGAVYDLIKIMSMPADDIKVDSNWKFTITKDEDNPVLLEFDTFEEKRMPASPTFLMARILKEHIRAIKKETGNKPTKLGFRLLDEFESAEARKRVESGLKEACGLIKTECLIV
uniref:Uncharacterized protein n=1 Tax=Panagrolaimus sp. ES5 TaxID=591445 RepID=A0AC34GYN2_9BILA